MNRSALLPSLGAAFALAACVSPLRPEITVYTKRDFAGAAERLHAGYPDLHEELPAFEDEISSFEIRRGVWEVCRRPDYHDCRVVDHSMADLGGWDLDNAISSLRPLDVDEAEYERRHEEHIDDEPLYRDDEHYDHRHDEDRYEHDHEHEDGDD
jgi:hypothetical protein